MQFPLVVVASSVQLVVDLKVEDGIIRRGCRDQLVNGATNHVHRITARVLHEGTG